MNELISINGNNVAVIEYQEKRVVTFAMVDDLHQRAEGTARRNFNENKKRFEEERDFFELNQPDEIRTLGFTRKQGGTADKIILLTERGYLKIVKSMKDDLSWKIQDMLVDNYFKVQEIKTTLESTANNPYRLLSEIALKLYDAVDKRLKSLESKNDPNQIWVTIEEIKRVTDYVQPYDVCKKEKVITKNEHFDGHRRNLYLVSSMPKRWQERLKEFGII